MVYEVENDKIPFYTQYVALLIIIINIIVFVIQLFDPTGYMFIYEAAFVPNEFFSGIKVWTIFTSMWMHADIVHISMNMLFFYVVADNCEKTMGHVLFLVTYIISGLVGSLLDALFAVVFGWGDIPSLGASGAIMGMIAAYGILFPRNKLRYFGSTATFSARTFIIITLLSEIIYGIISLTAPTGTAHFAHIGGFFVGLIVAVIVKTTKKKKT
ncbi:MAG TPA: rhomboid family intramembrane serine protease [Candidatus Lokiarchaeia archaeon]